jgi:quercetin dioxygenase-like cupin family protein
MTADITVPAGLSAELAGEFVRNFYNGRVGSRLVSETEDFRVWMLTLAPGNRAEFHRHQLHYFWTAVTSGIARSRYHDGRVQETKYAVGDTRHFKFGKGKYQIHDLENIGDTDLVFVTVESKRGAENPPLDIPRIEADLA